MYRQQFPQLASRVSIRGRVESMRAFRLVSSRVTTIAATGAFVAVIVVFARWSGHLLR